MREERDVELLDASRSDGWPLLMVLTQDRNVAQ
jgi:hypothetical protein